MPVLAQTNTIEGLAELLATASELRLVLIFLALVAFAMVATVVFGGRIFMKSLSNQGIVVKSMQTVADSAVEEMKESRKARSRGDDVLEQHTVALKSQNDSVRELAKAIVILAEGLEKNTHETHGTRLEVSRAAEKLGTVEGRLTVLDDIASELGRLRHSIDRLTLTTEENNVQTVVSTVETQLSSLQETLETLVQLTKDKMHEDPIIDVPSTGVASDTSVGARHSSDAERLAAQSEHPTLFAADSLRNHGGVTGITDAASDKTSDRPITTPDTKPGAKRKRDSSDSGSVAKSDRSSTKPSVKSD